MQVVIDIEDEIYWRIVKDNNNGYGNHATHAIRYGTPLPKGHGRLIDVDVLMRLYGLEDVTKYGNETAEQQTHSYDTMMMYEIADMIDDAPTIIEADKAGEEE